MHVGRYLDWDGVGAGRYRALCAVEEHFDGLGGGGMIFIVLWCTALH